MDPSFFPFVYALKTFVTEYTQHQFSVKLQGFDSPSPLLFIFTFATDSAGKLLHGKQRARGPFTLNYNTRVQVNTFQCPAESLKAGIRAERVDKAKLMTLTKIIFSESCTLHDNVV